MDSKHQLMFALQSPVGLRFGATVAVKSNRISFEMDIKLSSGTECPFRMELSGTGGTVMGTIRIDRIMKARADRLPQYVGEITAMGPADRERFDGWRSDFAEGGVSRHLERDPSLLNQQAPNQMMSGLTETEAKAVLERMNRRRARLQQKASQPAVDFGLSDEVGGSSVQAGANIREKLRREARSQRDAPTTATRTPVSLTPTPTRSAVTPQPASTVPPVAPATAGKIKVPEPQRPAPQQPTPAVKVPEPKRPAPTTERTAPVVAERAPPVEPLGSPVTKSAPADRPTASVTSTPVGVGSAPPSLQSPPVIMVNADARPIEIIVMYLSFESYLEDFDRTLHTSAITIDHPQLVELYQPVDIRFQFHDGQVLDAAGQMVALTEEGMAIALALNTIQQAQLALLAGI